MKKSKIEWTEITWNPVTGCTKISAGCKNCYAERMSHRIKAMGNLKYKNGFEVTLHTDSINEPFTWKSPKLVFVNSMSDLFHKQVPIAFLQAVFKVMNDTPKHTYQVLTKRADLLSLWDNKREVYFSPNIWMGVSVENQATLERIDFLRETSAKVKFLSIEPLLEPLQGLNLSGIDWVVVGGESGPGSRPMKKEWVLSILNECQKQKVPFFFKQWGGTNKKKNGRLLNGEEYNQMPWYYTGKPEWLFKINQYEKVN